MVKDLRNCIKQITCLVIIIIFSSICHVYAVELSVEEKEYLNTKGTIVFVSQTRYPPFEFTDASKQHEGMMVDIARWMAVEMGFQPVFIDMMFQQAQEAVLSGKADVLTSLFYSNKRNEKFEFTKTIFDVPASIFIKVERTDIKNIKDLNGKTIAIQKGDYAKDFLEYQKIRFTTLDTKDFAEAVDMVIAGKADAVIGDEQIVFYHIFNNRLTAYIKKVGEPLYIGRNCMASNKSNALLIRILNKGINEAVKSGVLDKVNKKWLGTIYGPRESFLYRHIWPLSAIAGGILLLSLWVWGWNVRLRILVRKKTEAIQENESKFRTLFEYASDAIILMDHEINIDCNQKTLEILGCAREQIIGQNPCIFSPDVQPDGMTSQEKRRQKNEAVISTGTQFFEWQFRRSDGSLRDSEISLNTFVAANKRYFLAIFRDITDRKRLENALFESEIKFKSYAEQSLAGIYLIQDGVFKYVNPTFARMFGYTVLECLNNMAFQNLVHAEDLDKVEKTVRERISGEIKSVHYAFRGIKKNGQTFHVEIYGSASFHERRPAAAGTILDVTERKRAEEALLESEERFKQLAEIFPETIFESDLDGNVTYANKHAFECFCYSDEDFARGLNIMNMVAPEDRQMVMARIRERVGGKTGKTGGYLEYLALRKDGLTFPALGFSAPIIRNGCPIGLRGFILDITERKQAEETLRLYGEIISNMVEGVVLVEARNGTIVYTNPKFEKMFGYDSWELAGKHISIVNAPTAGKSPLDVSNDILRSLKKTESWSGEIHNRKKDDSLFWCYANVSAFEHPGYGDVWISIHTDITERKRAEEHIQVALREKETLLKEIHHRVKNNLQVISSLLSLQSQHIEDKNMLEVFRESENRVKTMSLVHDMLYRSDTLSEIDYSIFIRNLVKVLVHAYRTDSLSAIKVNLDVQDIQLDIVMAIPFGLILNELISNALKHAFPGEMKGEISLSIRMEGDLLVMKLHDTGVGFPKTLDFRNTQSLGLQLVNILVEQINGAIELVVNREGTTFNITFSIVRKEDH